MTSEPVFEQALVQQWADHVLREWDKKVTALGIEDTGALRSSFENHVRWHAGGDMQRVEFAFKYYGRMVDWGVGNGVSLENRPILMSNDLTRRRPKPWFTDTFYKQVAGLRHLLSERTAQKVQLFIVRKIEE